MNKTVLCIVGVLLIAFGIGQGLQLLGLIGTKTFTVFGVAFTILGLALGTACFLKAFKTK